jgi:hypothetical protein
MKPYTKLLVAAAMTGALSAIPGISVAGQGPKLEKLGCNGKDGCSGKTEKDKTGKDKDSCSSKSGKDKSKDKDKDACSGKDGCSGKSK